MKRYLVLENGEVFEGEGFGADCTAVGELVFTTGMCGYIETLTDPSYYGQIVLQTFPLIGNYGIIEEDFEGKCAARGYVTSELCEHPSNFRCGGTVNEFLKKNGIPAICGVDTRELTRTIRESGVVNSIICDKIPTDLSNVRSYSVQNAVASVMPHCHVTVSCEGTKYRVVLMDFGAKENIIRSLIKRGCEVIRVPGSTKADEIFEYKPDGIMLSNGPGDPAENTEIIGEINKLFGKIPMFGICLGHQLMALSAGGKTIKMKYGHRGCNQPVKDIKSGRTYITSQNHGYAVLNESVNAGVISHINANDMTCEGIEYPDHKAFSVQFHPEACGGPKDTEFLFDEFCNLMKGNM